MQLNGGLDHVAAHLSANLSASVVGLGLKFKLRVGENPFRVSLRRFIV